MYVRKGSDCAYLLFMIGDLVLPMWTGPSTERHNMLHLGIVCSMLCFLFRWLSFCETRNFVFTVCLFYTVVLHNQYIL